MGLGIRLFLSFAGVFLITGCGDDGNDLGSDLANASKVMEFNGDKVVDSLGMTIKKLKVWKTRDNSKASGVSSVVSIHTIEIWYTLMNDGVSFGVEKKEKDLEENDKKDSQTALRYAQFSGLLSDDKGNLYFEQSEPGTVVYETPSGVSNSLTEDGLFAYTRESENGLVSEKFPPNTLFSRSIGNKITREVIEAPNIEGSPWGAIYKYSFGGSAQIGKRDYYESNEKLKVKGKAGCLYQTGTSGGLKKEDFYFADVELGNLIHHTKNRDVATSVSDDSTLGDDDVLWVKWNEYWYLTGVNYKTKTFRMIRLRVAPVYTGRELPGVDSSDDSPKLSSYDRFIRSCNARASANGQFRLLSFGVSTPSLYDISFTFNAGSAQSYCSSLKGTSAVDLDTTDTSYGCGFTISPVTAGTWDGTIHSGPVSAPAGTLAHVEMTEPTVVTF